MTKFGFYFCPNHDSFFVCGSCIAPSYHGNPSDFYKFYKTSATDKPKEFQTDDPKQYCSNHIEINGEFICQGHSSDNKNGFGKLDADGYHGSAAHDHQFYINETKEEDEGISMHETLISVSKNGLSGPSKQKWTGFDCLDASKAVLNFDEFCVLQNG
jgi:hypothetical protein